MNQFSFEYPLVFLLLLLFWVCARWCQEKSQSIFFPHVETLMIQKKSKSSVLAWLKWIGIVLSVSALASPVWTKNYTNSKKEGRDIVMILDASESMKQVFDTSYRSRFVVVKEVIGDFIEKREHDRIGMVTFADVAFIASPLTFEKKFLRDIIKMQEIGIAGQRTAINDALVQGYHLLSKSKSKSKVVILLTDGIDNMSKIPFEDVKSMIKKRDIKLYVIGVGGQGDYSASYLQSLAKAGKGLAFAATHGDALKKVYEEIDRLEVTKIDSKKVVEQTYFYMYPLFIAFLSLLLFMYLRHKKGI